MGYVSYNDKIIRPAPFVNITYNPLRNARNEIIGNNFDISLQATILANKGSPKIDGTYGDIDSNFCETITEQEWTGALSTKFCHLEILFNENYKKLVIGSSGYHELTCYPVKVGSSVNDTENPQFWRYTVDLKADNVYCDGTPLVSTGYDSHLASYEERWSITDTEEVIDRSGYNHIYSFTHTVSAQAIPVTYSGGLVSDGIDVAKEFVCARIGTNSTVPTNCAYYQTDLNRYNYVDVHEIDNVNLTYSVTESWIFSSGNAIEQYSVEHSHELGRACDTVTINGTITGYEIRRSGYVEAGDDKYSHALTKFNSVSPSFHGRVELYTGENFNSIPVSQNVGHNPLSGTITYAYAFDQRPTKLLSSAQAENIQVSNTWGEDIFNTVSILDKGELIQKINSTFYKAYTTSLSIEAIYPCYTGTGIQTNPRFDVTRAAEIQAVVDAANPAVQSPGSTVVTASQQETWTYAESHYNYNVSWTWQPSGVC